MDTIRTGLSGVKMIAHRGLSGIERENTAAAFIAAANRSYFGIETDVRRTADGRFVLCHDDSLDRVSGGQSRLTVSSSSYDTLRSEKLPDTDGSIRGDLIVPSLSEYASICKKYGKTAVLEIKEDFSDADIQRVCDEFRGIGILDSLCVISFSRSNLLCLRRLCPQVHAQLLVSSFEDELVPFLLRNRLGIDISYRALDAYSAGRLLGAGIEINVWTVNTEKDARRLAALGVGYITTNILE